MFDIEESGKQIGEKLFLLLNEEQKNALMPVSYTHLDVYKRQTHITGDLERAADYITYISYGELYFTGSKDHFVDMFRIVKGGSEELSDELKNKAAGIRTFPTGFEALMKTEDINYFSNLTVEPATIDEIVVFTSKKGDDYE